MKPFRRLNKLLILYWSVISSVRLILAIYYARN